MPERGEIWLADLDPRQGTEPGKTVPVLIVQAEALLRAEHPSTLVVPLTTRLIQDAEPLRVRVAKTGDLPRDSDALVDQLRAIDNRRLLKRLACPEGNTLERIDIALREVLDLV